MTDHHHRAWMEFIRKAMELPIEYSAADLNRFRHTAADQYPALVRVIDAYIALVRQSAISDSKAKQQRSPGPHPFKEDTPLLDLLRDVRLFPTNKDIAHFAQTILPNMRTYRFDKMAKSVVALKIIQYLETLNLKTRQRLEASMRDALDSPPTRDNQRKSFVSKWENIIRGIDLG